MHPRLSPIYETRQSIRRSALFYIEEIARNRLHVQSSHVLQTAAVQSRFDLGLLLPQQPGNRTLKSIGQQRRRCDGNRKAGEREPPLPNGIAAVIRVFKRTRDEP